MTLLDVFQRLEEVWIGEAIRTSYWLFPFIEAIHLVGLALLGGTVIVVDLRSAWYHASFSSGKSSAPKRTPVFRPSANNNVRDRNSAGVIRNDQALLQLFMVGKDQHTRHRHPFHLLCKRNPLVSTRTTRQIVTLGLRRSSVAGLVVHRRRRGPLDRVFLDRKVNLVVTEP